MMTEWEKKATAVKNYPNVILFFNDKMTSIKTYQDNIGNSSDKNGYASANAAIDIATSLKDISQGKMGTKDDKLEQMKAEHLLQMSILRTSNQSQDTELKDIGIQL